MPPWLDLTVRLSRLPVVSIAAIRGAARGVGQEFALACDLRSASREHTAIDQPEVSHRLVPGGGAISRLPALVGRARALEIILGSVVLDGAGAERYGVVNRALPDRARRVRRDALRRARGPRPSRAR
jgi:enoyl-CoA hydratase/carnithine racemase